MISSIPVWKCSCSFLKNIFHSEKYQNNIFYFLKIDISVSKWFKNTKKILIW
jgi:hypothetical protein